MDTGIDSAASASFVTEYLMLGLRFDRVEEGYVDSFTGDPALKRAVESEPQPNPADLVRQAERLLTELPAGLDDARSAFVGAHLRALACAGRKFAGEEVGFVDEVEAYFDVRIAKGDPERYRQAHAQLDDAIGGSGALSERVQAYRAAEEIPPARLEECIHAFSSALRDRVRSTFPLPARETINYEVVTDKPWSGFNYYLGDYRSTVAVNADLKQQMSNLPRLVAHESYPGHHTEHCRKEAGLVEGKGQAEQTIFLVNTPQCLMAEGLADLALYAAVGNGASGATGKGNGASGATGNGHGASGATGKGHGASGATGGSQGWGVWATDIYADLGLRFDGERAEKVSEATAALADVRQDAALMLHDEHRDVDDVVDFLKRWLLVNDERARQMLRFLSSPLWRAYTSTYVEGYRLLRGWLDARPDGVTLTERFGTLLDEPLIPSSLRTA